MSRELTQTDRDLINLMQEDLPLVSRPFRKAATELGLDEAEVIERLLSLRDAGILTRFGPFFDAEALGGAFCLCAMAVPEDRFEEVLTKVNAFDEVAHNYQRDHKLNMWFVLATEDQTAIENTAKAIERETGLNVLLFPKEQEFFIGFRVKA